MAGSELIERALQSAAETRIIDFGPGVLSQTGAVFGQAFPGARAIVVADENTMAVAGEAAEQSLAEADIQLLPPYVFPGTPTLYGDYVNVQKLREHLEPLENVIVCAVGAGTLNDIIKLASGELGREYMIVCTAASVDGYASFGASIARDGFKITRACPAPAALVVDTDVLAAAPTRLTATGYGDLIEKIPAGADWILADELGIEPIDPYVWSLVQGPLAAALADPAGAAAGDRDVIATLAEGNIMSGLAMQAMQSSRPASGAGHQFSHIWEMEGHGMDQEPPLSHGFKVGVGTVASLALWEDVLKLNMDDLDAEAIVAAAPTDEQVAARAKEALAPRIFAEAAGHAVSKNLGGEDLRQRILRVKEVWPRVVERSSASLISPQEAATRLHLAGAPSHPAEIGIDWKRFKETYFKAQMIRPRYTVLDLLTDLGLLETMVDKLFSADGYWGRRGEDG